MTRDKSRLLCGVLLGLTLACSGDGAPNTDTASSNTSTNTGGVDDGQGGSSGAMSGAGGVQSAVAGAYTGGMSSCGAPNTAGATAGAPIGGAGAATTGEPFEHVFQQNWHPGQPLVEECDPSEGIANDCFPITEQLGVRAEPIVEATTCSFAVQGDAGTVADDEDECGCDGKLCGVGKTCRASERECSCAPDITNVCVPNPCLAPSDCSANQVCVPDQFIFINRCLAAACKSDSACTASYGGRCGALFHYPNQGGNITFSAVTCVYEEAPDHPGSCPPGEELAYVAEAPRYYRCSPPP